MKYNKDAAEKILQLTNECLDDPEISSDDKLNLLLGDLNQKVTYQKRFKNSTDLRKQVGAYVRNHNFQMPKQLSDLLDILSEVNANSGSKRNWFAGFQN
ncbi:hypothetical protein [Companilactobacillus ginsenosidimutans]|uniref:Bacteriocin immunity protein n=1 Tax=Companilactobacillus ginsenosidimutans TaxID=1007676 RepID=A0A0H4QZR6_9LACO|nr:hypothetical protein [Companilactobacillus ginsenosidimutans]AKP66940.1 hypothetical protein ABM34_04940 [Companilactobacillus ginsenosidimutans]